MKEDCNWLIQGQLKPGTGKKKNHAFIIGRQKNTCTLLKHPFCEAVKEGLR